MVMIAKFQIFMDMDIFSLSQQRGMDSIIFRESQGPVLMFREES